MSCASVGSVGSVGSRGCELLHWRGGGGGVGGTARVWVMGWAMVGQEAGRSRDAAVNESERESVGGVERAGVEMPRQCAAEAN